MTPESAGKRLEILGFADPAGALRHLEALTGGVTRTAAIQRTLLPVLLQEFADAPEPDRGLLNYRHVSDKLGSTPWYLRLLRDGGPVARRLARVLSLSRYATDLLTRDPEALRLLADDAELQPRAARRAASTASPPAADAARPRPGRRRSPRSAALRRRELFRIACADMLSRAGDARPGPAARRRRGRHRPVRRHRRHARRGAAVARQVRPAPDGPAVRGHRHGPARRVRDELPVRRRRAVRLRPAARAWPTARPAPPRTPSPRSCAGCSALPAPDPPLGVDADLRPEGRQGPLVRSLAAYAQYYARWSKVWEAQALLRARFVCGDAGPRAASSRQLADPVRYPGGGLSREQVVEIRRIKARVETERLPRGADPDTHTKLGRGGLADVEWAVQLLQLRHAYAVPELRLTRDPRGADGGARGRADRQGRTPRRWPPGGRWPRGCATR